MHPVHLLTRLLASSAALALAVPVQPDMAPSAKLVARDSPFADLDLPADFWGAMDNYCRNGVSSKRRSVPRHLSQRGSPPAGYLYVSPGTSVRDYESTTTYGAYTDALVTCMGVVIVGDTTDGDATSKHMAHFYADANALDALWGTVASEVSAQGLANLRGWISLADRAAVPSDLDTGLMLDVENKMKDLVAGLTGQPATVRYHNMFDASEGVEDVGSMQYNNADKSVLIDGVVVEFGT
ncbi:hypothetical protein B0T22DRAFT_445544 [Podospora appendiculata]|uniref:Uncharacterized protein n=1 Tax=Podospora appendiculata TaxID=314037 RepID=A0AAE1C7D7_9PEZI|nr:hypothetical protein B0T22DRAFT_445544 [Podospora appendiculata]